MAHASLRPVSAFMNRPPWQRDLFGVLVIVMLLGLIGGRQVRDEYLLSQHAQPTIATVVSKSSGHGWIEYEYVVDGVTYSGNTPADATGKPFDKVVVGDTLVVNFDPTHPAVSGTTETRGAVRSTVPFLAMVFVGALVVVGIRQLKRK